MKHVREPLTDSVRTIPPGLALQQRERETSLQRLARLRKEASAEIERLIAFLDASDQYVSTELEEDISADLEDGDPAEDDDPAENDLEDEPSLGSLGTGEWSDQTKWAAGNRADLEDEHDGREPDASGIGDMEGLLEQVGSQSWQLDGYV